jgi:glycosyltransferase involved in cell wall biosynthesis
MTRRVLMTTTAYPPSMGGVQRYVADLRTNLPTFEADVVTLWRRHRTDWLLGSTVRLPETGPGEVEPGVRTLGWSAFTRLEMAPWVLGYYGLVPIAARRIARLMVPGLERLVDPEHAVIHNHRIGREFLARASLLVARRRGLPFVLSPYHHPRWRGPRYAGWIEVYRAADAVLALTRAEEEELVRLGVAPERVHVVGGAVEPALPADGRRFRERIGASRPIVLFLGQLYRYKGVAELMAAAEALNAGGARLDLVFAGPETPFSRDFFRRTGRPAWLHVLGSVDEQTKWDAIDAAAVVCLPSGQESFGRVYLEGWSKGKPVIGCRIPAVSEVVEDGRTGLLVSHGSAPDLARAIGRLLDDPALAARLGERGRTELEARFTWRAVALRTESVYERLLDRPPVPGLQAQPAHDTASRAQNSRLRSFLK